MAVVTEELWREQCERWPVGARLQHGLKQLLSCLIACVGEA